MYISMVWTEMMTFGPRLFSLLFSIILYDTLIILSLSLDRIGKTLLIRLISYVITIRFY
jgi:hypothetical protein